MTSKVWCDDWSCPARASCANHFGRSAAYAGMREGAKAEHGPLTAYDRHQSDDRQNCDKYRRDRAKPWLAPQPGQVTHSGPMRGGFASGDFLA